MRSLSKFKYGKNGKMFLVILFYMLFLYFRELKKINKLINIFDFKRKLYFFVYFKFNKYK